MIWAPFTRQRNKNPFAIVIWNSNGQKDDNFEIFLNNTSIGTIDNNHNDFTGRIFVDPSAVTLFTPDKFGPQHPNAFDVSISLDMSLLKNGANNLSIYRIQDNGNGNFGGIQVGFWKKNGAGFYVISNLLLSINYSGGVS